jgi:hypothetical protein
VTAELYPTAVRATAQGFTYNLGRIASGYAPRLVGSVAQTRGVLGRAVDRRRRVSHRLTVLDGDS